MKFRYITGLYILAFCVLMGIGLYNKSLYKDFDKEREPLKKFVVGVMPNSLTEAAVRNMEKKLEKSNLILAVKCKGDLEFQYSCATQKAEVKKVFRGNGIKEGCEIELCTVLSIFMDKNMYVDGKPCANLDFVNVMKKNKTYLVFLDRKIKNSNIYVKGDEFFVKPIFCYEQIKNSPCKQIHQDECSAHYQDISDNEFFITSRKGIQKMEEYKNYLIHKYAY